jgi:hypothetical protein
MPRQWHSGESTPCAPLIARRGEMVLLDDCGKEVATDRHTHRSSGSPCIPTYVAIFAFLNQRVRGSSPWRRTTSDQQVPSSSPKPVVPAVVAIALASRLPLRTRAAWWCCSAPTFQVAVNDPGGANRRGTTSLVPALGPDPWASTRRAASPARQPGSAAWVCTWSEAWLCLVAEPGFVPADNAGDFTASAISPLRSPASCLVPPVGHTLRSLPAPFPCCPLASLHSLPDLALTERQIWRY